MIFDSSPDKDPARPFSWSVADGGGAGGGSRWPHGRSLPLRSLPRKPGDQPLPSGAGQTAPEKGPL